jgi:hypothetical protein
VANVIIKKPDSLGKTRSEHEENLRKEWGRTMTDEQLDKLRYMEKRIKDKTGKDKCFITGNNIDKIK